MPTYSYTCDVCNIKTVKLCKMDERDNQICDTCQTLLTRGIDRPGAIYAPTATGGGLKV